MVLGSSLAVFGAWGIVVFGLMVGLAIYVHQVESLSSLAFLALGRAVPVVSHRAAVARCRDVRESGRRAQCRNNLKQIVLALQSYHQANGCFPPAYIADKNGKPMHSWRVLILPYLDRNALYKAYNFSEPWDGPNNKKLLALASRVYDARATPQPARQACPDKLCCRGGTERGLGGREVEEARGFRQGCLAHDHARRGDQLRHRLGGTEGLVAGHAWSGRGQVAGADLSSNHGRREEFFFIYDHASGVNVAMADGSVHYLRPGSLSAEDLRKLLQIGGCKEEELLATQ